MEKINNNLRRCTGRDLAFSYSVLDFHMVDMLSFRLLEL
jgi:hypothetical protein